MTAEQIAKKYVHGLHDALTDRQEIKDMMADIEAYAEAYHKAKVEAISDEEIDKQLWQSRSKRQGAKWLKNKLLNK